jgi:hypothetical protein
LRAWCRHFNGVMNKACDVGVKYDDVAQIRPNPDYDPNKPVWQRGVPEFHTLPCFANRPESVALETCSQRDYYTTEEQEQMEADAKQHVRDFFTKIEQGICPECDQPMTKKQVGPCVYAEPCAHRLYQGRVS